MCEPVLCALKSVAKHTFSGFTISDTDYIPLLLIIKWYEVNMALLQLPKELIEHIFSFLSYEEVAKIREVSRELDKICQGLLNRGFIQLEERRIRVQNKIISQGPSSDNDLNNHPLFIEYMVVMLCGMTICFLGVTYNEYIKKNKCCFIPGKLLDLIRRFLDTADSEKIDCDLLMKLSKELKNDSRIAMDHFHNSVVIDFAHLSLID
ncbi:unnamed protein product [Leptidea sinapis]|uniref:F-box domain-containing protein n=1 Tax=Leptidea sinapis TaxID=189913 RepID=A0A5E4QQQ3_9NEOP|nr:unnamed protein product [Leptidea sinapis]